MTHEHAFVDILASELRINPKSFYIASRISQSKGDFSLDTEAKAVLHESIQNLKNLSGKTIPKTSNIDTSGQEYCAEFAELLIENVINKMVWSKYSHQYQPQSRFSGRCVSDDCKRIYYPNAGNEHVISSRSTVSESSKAVLVYGRIAHKLRKLKQLELSRIKLLQKVSTNILECTEKIGLSTKLKSLSIEEFNLLIDLLSIYSHNSSSYTQNKYTKVKTSQRSSSNSFDGRKSYNDLDELAEKLHHQIRGYRQTQASYLQAKQDELQFLQWLRRVYTTTHPQGRDNSKNLLISPELTSCVPILATLEPIVHRIFSSSKLTVEQLTQISELVEQELQSSGLTYIPTSDVDKSLSIDRRVDRQSQEYSFFRDKIEIEQQNLSMEEARTSMREQHKEMFKRIASACHHFCPYHIELE